MSLPIGSCGRSPPPDPGHPNLRRPRRRASLPGATWYYELLRPLCSKIELWRTTYYHFLGGGAPDVVEWFKGSGLRPFLTPLNALESSVFLERYTAAIAKAYPALSDGSVLLPFPRIFLTAIR